MKSNGERASDKGHVQSSIAPAVLMSDDNEGNASEGFLSAVEKQWLLLGKKPQATTVPASGRGGVQDVQGSGQAQPQCGRPGRQETQEEEIARLVTAQT